MALNSASVKDSSWGKKQKENSHVSHAEPSLYSRAVKEDFCC